MPTHKDPPPKLAPVLLGITEGDRISIALAGGHYITGEVLSEVVEDLVRCSKAGVVAPAVDVRRLDVEDLLPETFRDVLRDAGPSRSAGSSDDRGVGGLAICDRLKDARQVVNLGVAMLNLSGNEAGMEDASIADHAVIRSMVPDVSIKA